jgi:hypothetical protein
MGTTNYNFNKPTYGTRNWDVPINENWDSIDNELNKLLTQELESTGYGVISGLTTSAQSTPNMTVSVITGLVYMSNGTRYTPTANTALVITTADETNPRIDIVYVNSTGVISYLAGTPLASPVAPTLPTGGLLLAEIAVAAGVLTINNSDITDERKIKNTTDSNHDEIGILSNDLDARGIDVQKFRLASHTDDTLSFSLALDSIITNGGGTLLVPFKTSVYTVSSSIIKNLPDNTHITIIGIGKPTIKFIGTGVTAVGGGTDIFRLRATNEASVNVNVSILGINFDGSNIPEQWTETVFADMKTISAVDIHANVVIIEDCVADSFYGYGFKIRRYDFAVVNRCTTNKVGGKWYLTDDYDSFGDSVYFAYANSSKSMAFVTNCSLVGYPSDRPRLSRIGIAFEYGASQCYINNCFIDGYNRTFHEENCPNISLTIDSVRVDRYDIGLFIAGGGKSFIVNNLKLFNQGTGDFGGLKGIFSGYGVTTQPNIIKFTNCEFAFNGNLGNSILGFTESVDFNNCNFYNNGATNPKWVIANGSMSFLKCKFNDVILYLYNIDIKNFSNTNFIGSINNKCVLELDASSNIQSADNCLFDGTAIFLSGGISWYDNCKFKKNSAYNFELDGFIRGYNTILVALKNCHIDSATAIEYTATGWAAARYIGSNTKLIDTTWSKIAETV